jgi:hypothetical protein
MNHVLPPPSLTYARTPRCAYAPCRTSALMNHVLPPLTYARTPRCAYAPSLALRALRSRRRIDLSLLCFARSPVGPQEATATRFQALAGEVRTQWAGLCTQLRTDGCGAARPLSVTPVPTPRRVDALQAVLAMPHALPAWGGGGSAVARPLSVTPVPTPRHVDALQAVLAMPHALLAWGGGGALLLLALSPSPPPPPVLC